MAKQYYTAEEALKKLGVTENDLRALVREGKIREFRDAGKLNYRVEEVDALVAQRASSASGSGEILLEPADEGAPGGLGEGSDVPGLSGAFGGSSILSLEDSGLADLKADSKAGSSAAGKTAPGKTATPAPGGTKAGSGAGRKAPAAGDSGALSGSDVLSLDEVDKETVGGMRKDDTVITNVGISVFDDDDLEIAADPMAKTIATGATEHLGLDGSGAGSGLLDLTRESDDTSLGADVLGDIEAGEVEATQADEATATVEPAVGAEGQELEPAAEPVMRFAPAYAALPHDPTSPIFSGLLVVGMVLLALVGAASAASTLDVWPSYLDLIYQNLLIFTLASLGAGGLAALIGWLVGRQPDARPKPAAKRKAG